MQNRLTEFIDVLNRNPGKIYPVIEFDVSDRTYLFDFTENNRELSAEIISDTCSFSDWIKSKLTANHSRYGTGGYQEHRKIYNDSALFNMQDEPRRFHLGADLWGDAGTPVYCPLDAAVHSFNFNDQPGDYGATIILEHQLEDITFYSLYGHLNVSALKTLKKGMPVTGGTRFAAFGSAEENGHWPPHLHFQLMFDMQGYYGDYPGVCRFSERETWLDNCPDPHLILRHTFA